MKAIDALESHNLTGAARFANLKSRLLLQRLNETPESETHALIIQQANEASLLACLSGYPLLAFPCLFEERALAATQDALHRARRYWNRFQPSPLRDPSNERKPAPIPVVRQSLTAGRYLILIRQQHVKKTGFRLTLPSITAAA